MKRSYLLIILLSLSLTTAWAGNFYTGDTKKTKTDTVIYKVSEEDEEEVEDDENEHEDVDIVYALDSTAFIPAYSFYSSWDTTIIHPANFKQTLITDTTDLALLNGSLCGYAHPYLGKVTSDFGPRKKRFHYGIDIDLETGDSVVSAFDGMVRIAKLNKSYGNLVVVRHNNGLETYYAHLSHISVQSGQMVQAGDVLGLGGNTGRSRGSHLHFEVRFKGKPLNPNDLISFKENSLITDCYTISSKSFEYAKLANKVGGKGKGKKPRYHVVRKGDTLSRIAVKYRTSTKQLCRLNGIRPTTLLKPGKKLKI